MAVCGGRVVDRRAGIRDLHQGKGGDHLGVPDDERPGHRGRPCERRRGHRHVTDRHARLGGDQAGVDAAAVVAERARRALHHGEDRPRSERVAAADDRRGHLDRGACLALGDDGLRLDMLRGVGPAGQQLVERPRGRRPVLGGDRDPVEGDLVESVRQAGDLGHVGQARRPALARVEVGNLDPAAVRGGVDVLAVERQVQGRVAGRQGIDGRGRLHGSLDDRLRRLDHEGLAVHLRAGVRPEAQGALRREADPDVLDHVERRLVDPGDRVGVQHLHAEAAGADRVHGRAHRATSSGVAPTSRFASSTAPMASSE